MEKFHVLQSHRRFMSSILRIDVEEKANRWMKSTDKFFESIPVLLIFFILFSASISSAVTVSTQSNGFTIRLAMTLMFIAMCQASTILLNTGVNMQKIVVLYRTLQTIVDSKCMINFDLI